VIPTGVACCGFGHSCQGPNASGGLLFPPSSTGLYVAILRWRIFRGRFHLHPYTRHPGGLLLGAAAHPRVIPAWTT